jgi:hypothetical protein
MKNLKSVLALVMALVIGVCLTACQTNAQKAESERLVSEIYSRGIEDKQAANVEFESWFRFIHFTVEGINVYFSEKAFTELINSDVKLAPNEFSGEFKTYHNESNIPLTKSIYATVFVDKKQYTSENCKVLFLKPENNIVPVIGMTILFPELSDPDYEGVSAQVSNKNEFEIAFEEVTSVDSSSEISLESADIYAVLITIKDDNGEEITLTHYTNV